MEEDMTKFKPDFAGVEKAKLVQFSQDYLAKKLKAHLLSQEPPQDWNKGPVVTLVSKNFHSFLQEAGKNVIVEFCELGCS